MNKLLGDQEQIESDEQIIISKQIHSFEDQKQSIWSYYLNTEKNKTDSNVNKQSIVNNQTSSSFLQITDFQVTTSHPDNCNTNKENRFESIKPKPQQVFKRLYEDNIKKSQMLQKQSKIVQYSFSPNINKNSLKILQNCKHKIKKQKSQNLIISQSFSANKSVVLEKSKKILEQKFIKQINSVIKFMSEKLNFDCEKKFFTLEETFYILTGLKYIKYNPKMSGFLENQENLIRKMWKKLSRKQQIQKQILIGFLMLIEGIQTSLKELVDINREQYNILYFNRLNYNNQNKTPQQHYENYSFNPKILERSKYLTKQYRRKKGLSTQISEFNNVLEFYQIKQQEHDDNIIKLKEDKEQKQIQQCTFKPKTTPKSSNVQSLYNKPQKKRESFFKKTDLSIQVSKQNIKPMINKAKTPTCVHEMPKAYNKEIFRMRNSFMQKESLNQKLNYRRQKPDDKGKILLNVDVDINENLTQKITIYQKDQIDIKVDNFASKYKIENFKKNKIKQIIKEQIKKINKIKHLR